MNLLLAKLIEFFKSFDIPENIIIFVVSIIPFFFIIIFLILIVIILVLAERKLLAFFTQRKGPNRVGPWGIFQTVADAIKLLCKENIELLSSDKFIFTFAPLMAFSVIIILWCIIPYNSDFHLINSIVSLLLYFVVASIPMLFHFLAGYSSNNKYAMLGAYRAISLTVSYSVPIIFSILSVIAIAGSMDLNIIILYQYNGWIIFQNVIGFIVFFISAIAKLDRCPFDLSEAESELVCGYHTEYSGIRFAMFFLGEYAEFFVMAMLIAILFFGGYLPPFDIYLSNIFLSNCSFVNYFLYFEQTLWLVLKTIIIIFSIIWIRATFPRLTQFSILNIFWKYLTPLSIINLIVIIILKMRI